MKNNYNRVQQAGTNNLLTNKSAETKSKQEKNDRTVYIHLDRTGDLDFSRLKESKENILSSHLKNTINRSPIWSEAFQTQ